jgi:hypothetical protein
MPGKFPRPYVNDIPNPETVSGIEYVPFRNMDIGARKSGMPSMASCGPNKLDHVGTSASGRSK